jgi:hypothetical protein
MTITFKKDETIYESHPKWNSRNFVFDKTRNYNGRNFTGYKWEIQKSAHGVSIETEGEEQNTSIYFTFAEFKEFIEYCKWVDECNVIEDGE